MGTDVVLFSDRVAANAFSCDGSIVDGSGVEGSVEIGSGSVCSAEGV